MNAEEMKQLKPGDKVQFSDGTEGTILATSKYAVEIDWQDGQHGFIAVEDGEQVTKL